MKPGDLVHVDVNLVVNLMGRGGAPFGIYLGEFKDPVFGRQARLLTCHGEIYLCHHDWLVHA